MEKLPGTWQGRRQGEASLSLGSRAKLKAHSFEKAPGDPQLGKVAPAHPWAPRTRRRSCSRTVTHRRCHS